ncbi:MAG: response regulator [Alphaproteobacteria bacterium]|nr:response regulator [Alphaproteobacteria bacterium]
MSFFSLNNCSINKKILAGIAVCVFPTILSSYFLIKEKEATIQFTRQEITGAACLPPMHMAFDALLAGVPAHNDEVLAALAKVRQLCAPVGHISSRAGMLIDDVKSGRASADGLLKQAADIGTLIIDESNIILDPVADTYFLGDAVGTQSTSTLAATKALKDLIAASARQPPGANKVAFALLNKDVIEGATDILKDLDKVAGDTRDGDTRRFAASAGLKISNALERFSAANDQTGLMIDTSSIDALASAVRRARDRGDAHISFLLVKRDREAVNDLIARLAISLLAVLGGILVATTVVRSITRPIISITALMEKLTAGDLTIDIPPKKNDDEVGKLTVALKAFHDASVARNMAVEAERNRVAAEKANEAKSLFLANMSHEIRTPLNSILATAEIMEEQTPDAGQKRYLSIIRNAGELLLTLLNDILDLSKIEAQKLRLFDENFDIRAKLELAFDLFRSSADAKGLDFYAHIDPALPRFIIADPSRVQQVVSNLISNAIKYTEKGEIRMAAKLVARDDAEFFYFEVRDTGKGIPPESQKLIFEKFEQAHKSSAISGTGLGLAICHSLIEMMHGQIGVDSAVGAGSTFWFEIPLRRGAQMDTDAANPLAQTPSLDGCRVLLVEDVDVNRMLIAKMLTGLGCAVETAVNGLDATERAAAQPFDIILMDCSMPVMNGFDATRRIRANGTATPIIAVSAHALVEEVQSCLDAGMNDYLAKPVSKKDLALKIAKWVARKNDETPPISAPAASAAASPLAPPPASGFDDQVLTQWLREMPDKIDEITALAIKGIDDYAPKIRDAATARDADALWQNAHALKSVALQIGAVALAEDCKKIEMLGRQNIWDGVGELVDAAGIKCAGAAAWLQKWQATP